MALTSERLSVAESVTVPLVIECELVGAVLSIHTAGEPSPIVLPAPSVAVTSMYWALPSDSKTKGLACGRTDARPEPPSSVTSKDMDTDVLFQPSAFGAGEGPSKMIRGAIVSK